MRAGRSERTGPTPAPNIAQAGAASRAPMHSRLPSGPSRGRTLPRASQAAWKAQPIIARDEDVSAAACKQ